MKEQIKIIFFDVDGTLIDMQKKEASPKILDTLYRLKERERGIILCLAIGRGPFALPKINGFSFDAFLTFNGSLCYDQNGIIYQNPLTYDDVHTFIDNAHALGKPLSVATSEKTYANGTEPNLDKYFAFGKMKVNISDKFNEIVENEEIYQILIAAQKKDYAALLKNTTSTKITAWWDKAVDVIPTSGGKGIGVLKILEHLSLPEFNTWIAKNDCLKVSQILI